jgi:hypothetical protein
MDQWLARFVGVLIGLVIVFGGFALYDLGTDAIKDDRLPAPEGAWCSEAGGTYYPNGVWLDGYAVQAPSCIVNYVEET